MSKKIFLLITKAEVGGAQMSVLNLARGLARDGWEVKVGFGEGNFLSKELKKESISYYRFKNLKRTHNPLTNLLFVWEVKKYFDKKNFSILHINSSNALISALGAKLSQTKPKTVFTFRGMSLLDENYRRNSLLRYFYKLFFKFFLKFVDRPVFVSRQNLEKGEQEGLVKKGYLVYNGLEASELNFYTSEESREKLKKFFPDHKLSKDIFLIGSIGRLSYQKNYEFLIRVFPEILKIIPQAVAIIIGGGPEKDKLEKEIRDRGLGGKIILAGSIDNASRYLKALDLFILPSRYEGLSITLIETLFAGVPVLTTRVGGNPETLPLDQEIYQLDDKKDFLDKLQKLVTEETREEISKQNLEYSHKFLIEKTIKGYQEIYKK